MKSLEDFGQKIINTVQVVELLLPRFSTFLLFFKIVLSYLISRSYNLKNFYCFVSALILIQTLILR